MLPQEKKSEWKNHIRMYLKLSYGVQPLLSHVQKTTPPPNRCYIWHNTSKHYSTKSTKFIQKIRECAKWAHKKADAFQAKEAQHHKKNYDKYSRAAALEVGDTVLVQVTAFKGCHKIQDRWDNREYVVEKQPYPNIPVYLVHPRDGKGYSWTLHRNYLLPINSNIGQDEKDTPVAGVENNNTSTPVSSVDSEPADAGPSGMVTPSAAGSTPQGSPDKPAPLICGTWNSQNQLPQRYQNFGLLAATSPSSIWDALVGLCTCLHVISCLYTIFWGSTVWIHSTYTIMCLPSTTQFWHWGGILSM